MRAAQHVFSFRQLFAWLAASVLAFGIALIAMRWRPAATPQAQAATLVALHGRTMGSSYTIRYLTPAVDVSTAQRVLPEQVQAAVQRDLAEINRLWSRWQSDSELSQFNATRSTEWISVAPATADLIEQSKTWTELSQGRFDLTVAPLVDLWGFGPHGRVEHKPTDEAILAARAHVGLSQLQVRRSPPSLRKSDPELQLDLSSFAAGCAADRVSATLLGLGFDNHYVEIAGEISVHGLRSAQQGWQIGIEHPQPTDRKLLMTVELRDECIATSGNYRNRYWLDGIQVVHTLDATTGRPVTHQTISATVIDPSCTRADALATVLMTLPADEALELANQQNWAALLVEYRDGEYHQRPSQQFQRRQMPVTASDATFER